MRLGPLTLLVSTLAACGGGDLTLPGPGEPASLAIVSGDGQQGLPGELIANPLVVQLLDRVGQPVSGRAVGFRFLSDVSGAELNPGEASTDAAGQVSARVRLGQETGTQAIEAFVTTPGEDLRVQFGLRAKAAAAPTPPDDGNPGPGGGGNEGGGSAGGDNGSGGVLGGDGGGGGGGGEDRGGGGNGGENGNDHGGGNGKGHGGANGHGHEGGQGDD
jgi:hypothetical protein